MHLKLSTLLLLLPGLMAQQPPQQPQPANARPEPMPVPRSVVLPRGTHEIAIDGSLTDWPELPAFRLDDQRQLSGTAANAWRGPKDLSAVAFLMWDREALFVSCVVQDEWHRALEASSLMLSEVPAADSVMLSFDPERNTRSLGPDPGRREDREFWLADEQGRQVVQWDRLRGTARVLDGKTARMVVLHDKERSVTTYEARIAWNEILPVGQAVATGLVLDMQIVVNDFDESTDGMPQTRIGWTFGCGPRVDPGLFGAIMLVDDLAVAGMPEFPSRPAAGTAPGPTLAEWQQLTARLLALPPAPYDGSKAPEEAGGLGRFAVLEEIDAHCARFPRVDNVELHHRIHRRMLREVAGANAQGLPFWWHQRLEAVSKAAEVPVPNSTVRLFRLPAGGWLVRTPDGGFLIDAAGADVPEYLWGAAGFCVLTQPLDMTRRNDQLLIRMLQADPRRPVFTHIAFHLPVVSMAEVPLFEPGQTFSPAGGVEVQALGKKQPDGAVTWSCSYVLKVPAGPRLLLVAQNLRSEEADVGPIDVLILSPRNPEALAIVQRIAPRLVLVDDGFLCEVRPDQARMGLQSLHALQKAMRPALSLILAPGESWDIQAVTRK